MAYSSYLWADKSGNKIYDEALARENGARKAFFIYPLYKPLFIAAVLTQRFDSVFIRKGVVDCRGTLALDNFLKRLIFQIAQRQQAVTVHTARNDTAVGKHRQMSAQAVAESTFADKSVIHRRPNKLLCLIYKNIFLDSQPSGVEFRVFDFVIQRKFIFNHIQKLVVFFVFERIVQIPQAHSHQRIIFARCADKIEYIVHVLPLCDALAIIVKAVQRYIQLAQCRFAYDFVGALSQKDAVGRDIHAQIVIIRDIEKLRQKRMQKRLAHYMKENIFRVRADLPDYMLKFVGGHEYSLATIIGTKAAIKIARVCYFYINSFKISHKYVYTYLYFICKYIVPYIILVVNELGMQIKKMMLLVGQVKCGKMPFFK